MSQVQEFPSRTIGKANIAFPSDQATRVGGDSTLRGCQQPLHATVLSKMVDFLGLRFIGNSRAPQSNSHSNKATACLNLSLKSRIRLALKGLFQVQDETGMSNR